MPLDYSKLKGRIIEKFGNGKNFANAMELSEHSLSVKLNGKTSWKQSEIVNACDLLDITHNEIAYYFFNNKTPTNVLDEALNELIPKQADEIKRAIENKIPIMLIDNTDNGGEVWAMLQHLLKKNNAILIPETVAEIREYNTAYLQINLNNAFSSK